MAHCDLTVVVGESSLVFDVIVVSERMESKVSNFQHKSAVHDAVCALQFSVGPYFTALNVIHALQRRQSQYSNSRDRPSYGVILVRIEVSPSNLTTCRVISGYVHVRLVTSIIIYNIDGSTLNAW